MVISEEKRKALLGKYYIDTNVEKKKSVYVDVIKSFINSDNTYLPFVTKITSNKVFNVIKGIKSNYETIHLLNLSNLILDCDTYVKDSMLGYDGNRNDLFIIYDSVKKEKIVYVRRGYYSSYNVLSPILSKNTLIRIYNMLVYNVISYQILNRRKKDIFKKYSILIDNTKIYKHNKTVDNDLFSVYTKYDDNYGKYSLNKNTMKLKQKTYDINLKAVNKVKAFNSFKEMEEFLDELYGDKAIPNDEQLECCVKEKYNKMIENLVKQSEDALSLLPKIKEELKLIN